MKHLNTIFNLFLFPLLLIFFSTVSYGAATADVSLSKTASQTSVTIGDNFNYTIEVTNHSNSNNALDLTLTDSLPEEVTYVSASGTGWNCTISDNDLTCTKTELIKNASSVVTVEVIAAEVSSVNNSASVATEGTDDTDASNNNDSVTVNIHPATLSIDKKVSSPKVKQGTSFTYTIEVKNDTLSSAGDIKVIDVLPDDVDINITSSNINSPGWSCSEISGVVTCILDSNLSSSNSATIVLNVTAPSPVPSPATIINEATLTADDGTSESDTAETLILETAADLTITKVALDKNSNLTTVENVGSSFQYVIDVTNNDSEEAINVVVTDKLPIGVDINITSSNINSPSWNCTLNSDTVTCEFNGNMPTGTHPIFLDVIAPEFETNIVNTATVDSDNDTDTTNNTAFVIVQIVDTGDPSGLCYINSTSDSQTNSCVRSGTLWNLGTSLTNKHCTASIDIVNQNTGDPLTNIVVYKLYSPTIDLDRSKCLPDGGCTTSTITPKLGWEAYTGAHIYNINYADIIDDNVTLVDYDTYNPSPEINSSILYAEYEKDGLTYAGRVSACPTSGLINISDYLANVDVVDSYTLSPYESAITTKVTDRSGYTVNAVYLGTGDLVNLIPQPYTTNGLTQTNQAASITILLELAEFPLSQTTFNTDTCQAAQSTELFTTIGGATKVMTYIDYGVQEATTNNFVMAYTPDDGTTPLVNKNMRFKYKAVDFNQLILDSGIQCINKSSTGGVVEGLPACTIANLAGNQVTPNQAIENYIALFGEGAYERCYLENGEPCVASNGGVGDAPYNDEYGCFECSLGEFPYTCSRDNFAIRPDRFDVNITNTDIFAAGEAVNLLFGALDGGATPPDERSFNYNEIQNESFYIDLNVSNNTNCPVKNLTMTPEVIFDDGLHLGDFTFDDVGDINMTIHETNGTEYAIVDADDTSLNDRLIQEFNVNFRVIPDHFNIDVNLTDHNTDNNITYLHDINAYNLDDNYFMGSVLTIDIKAMAEDNNITRNYMETCYEKNTTLQLAIDNTVITYPDLQPLTQFLYYNPEEYDGIDPDSGEGSEALPAPVGNTITITSLPIENLASSFPPDAPEGNGTTHIEYKLNFDRKLNLLVNPIEIEVTDVNITDTDNVYGEDTLLDQNSTTLYYARTRASQFFYDDVEVTDLIKQTPIAIDVYCDLGYTICPDVGIDTANAQTPDLNWWLSLGHNTNTFEDGNVTLQVGALIEGAGAPSINSGVTTDPANVRINAGGIQSNVIVTANAVTVPMTVPIELVNRTEVLSPGYGMFASPYTNHWLIYNKYSATDVPSPFYKVRFIGVDDWAGKGNTGWVVGGDSSTKKNNRLGW